MADERDEQATQVGHQVIGEGGSDTEETTAVRQTPEAPGAVAAGSAQAEAITPPTPPPPSTTGEGGGTSPAEADRIAADQHDAFAEKPHLYALGAFAGAFVVAQILKRITGGDDD